MFAMLGKPRVWLWGVLCAGLLGGTPALAEVLALHATLEAEVRQFVDGQEASFDSAFEEFEETSSTLPLNVTAHLEPSAELSESDYWGAALGDFRNPALALLPNPAEFGAEAHAYAADSDTHLECSVVVVEEREVRFSADDLRPSLLDLPFLSPSPDGSSSDLGSGPSTDQGPLSLSDQVLPPDGENSPRRVRSTVFVSGAVLVWSADPQRDLEGLGADLEFVVEQRLPESDPVVVKNVGLRIEGAAGGAVIFTPVGDLFAFAGGPEILSPVLGFTSQQLLQEIASLGRLRLVIVPPQGLTYAYDAPVDVPFSLQATVRIKTVNLPGDTGVAAVFGRSFAELAQAVGATSGMKVSGEATQASVNRAVSTAQAPRIEPTDAAARSRGTLPCGVLGAEALLLPVGLVGLAWLPRRRGK